MISGMMAIVKSKKIKKILLVSANKFAIPYPVYPIGLSFISTYLQARLHDCDIRIFDFIMKDMDDYIRCLVEFNPDYVGVSLRNIDDVNAYNKESFIEGYKSIINITRKNSRSKIIIGGSGFSIYPKLLFEYTNPDFGIVGEGEESFYQLLTRLENDQDCLNIKGLVFKKDDEIIINERENNLQELNLKFDKAIIYHYWQNSGMLNIQTKRGCPYKCIYCTYPLIEGKTVRLLSADKIVETLKELYFGKKIDYVFFTDSVFNLKNEYNYELAEKIIESKVKIRWGAYFSPHNLDEKLLRILKKAGLTHIEFGTESLSNVQLKNYGKQFTVSDIMQISKLCNKLEIDFAHFLILCGYGETEESLNETFKNSELINKTVFFPFIGMRIYPGTPLHKIAIKELKIKKDDSLINPEYYISDKIDLATLKDRAQKSGKRWVFPDEDMTEVMSKMRLRNKKGPLWEYLIR